MKHWSNLGYHMLQTSTTSDVNMSIWMTLGFLPPDMHCKNNFWCWYNLIWFLTKFGFGWKKLQDKKRLTILNFIQFGITFKKRKKLIYYFIENLNILISPIYYSWLKTVVCINTDQTKYLLWILSKMRNIQILFSFQITHLKCHE